MSAQGGVGHPALPPGKTVSLTVIRGPDSGTKYDFVTPKVTVGRKRGELLLRDRECSGVHASIEATPDGRFVLKDLGSTNGTFLDGRRVTIAEISSGQQVKCGANSLLFTIADESGSVTSHGQSEDIAASLPAPAPVPAWARDVSTGPRMAPPQPQPDPFGSRSTDGEDLLDLPMPANPWELPAGGRSAPPAAAARAGASPLVTPGSDIGPLPDLEGPLVPPAADLRLDGMSQPPSEPAPPQLEPFDAPGDLPVTPPGETPDELPDLEPLASLAGAAPPSPPAWTAAPPPPSPAWPASPTPGEVPPPVVGATRKSAPVAPAPAAAEKPRSSPSWDVREALSDADATPPGGTALAAAEAADAPSLPPGIERSVYGVYLVVERGRDKGQVFPINASLTVIGRSGTDIVINDPDISRRHAALDVQGQGKYLLRDLHSTNGTLLNGIKVEAERIVENDKIRMGGTSMKLVVGDGRVGEELRRIKPP